VVGLPRLDSFEDVCESCATGKAHREAFDKTEVWRASQPLELVHSDVCGPMQVTTGGGNRYFLTFIDDYTRMCWVFFLTHKSSVFSVFKRFKAMVELQSGFQIKKLRSDRGGEYTSAEFSKFCEDMGLERQLTVAYSPQQNGVAERKNRTIVEMARTMLHEKKMPTKFWGEAVNTAVYILNRCPTSALKNKTPFEAFSGRKPGVKHMRVFDSLCYTNIPSQLKHKLEDTGEKGVFIGYGTCEKGYRVFNLKTQKVIVSRSVIFDEKSLWNWETSEEVHMPIPWDSGEKAGMTEGEVEFESPNQALSSPSARSTPNDVLSSARSSTSCA
jgi:transposase InsO family protein